MVRSWFLAPAGNGSKLAEGLASGADALVLDISQSTASDIDADHRAVTAFLTENSVARMAFYILVHDARSALLQADIAALVPLAPAGIMLPRADGGEELQKLDVMISAQEALAGLPVGNIRIVALTGDHGGVAFSGGTYRGKSDRLAALGWWADRAASSIGVNRLRETNGRLSAPLETVRASTLLGASRAGVQAIDTPSQNIDIEGFRLECDSARGDGFAGKIAVSAEQAAIINAVFGL